MNDLRVPKRERDPDNMYGRIVQTPESEGDWLGLTRTVRSKTTDTNPFRKHSEWSWSTEVAPVTTVKSLYWIGFGRGERT